MSTVRFPEGGPPKAAGIILTTIGWSPNFLKGFLQECSEAAVSKAKTLTTFHSYNNINELFKPIKRPTRPLRTIDLDLKTKQQLVEDIQKYLEPASVRFYATRGIPHRRGYLFHGPPGTGKTSMSVALAGHFQLDLYIMNLAAFNKGDAALAATFEMLPRKCIVLLEDIDSAGIKRENIRKEKELDAKANTKERSQRSRNPITLSGLLNAIDGATSQEGRVLIMTTNDPEALDDALIRPGRIDMQIFFGPVSQRVAEQIFVRMYTRDYNTKSSALSYTSENPISEDSSIFTKLLTTLRFLSWWKVLTVWLLPPIWAMSALYYLVDMKIIVSVWLAGVCIYTTMVMLLVYSLAIFWREPGPTIDSLAMALNSNVLADPTQDGSPMTDIEREELREMARDFGRRIPENRFTPAEVQGFLIMNMEDPIAALARIDDWVARLLAAKERGTNIIPDAESIEHTPQPESGQPTTTSLAGHPQHEPPMTSAQTSDPSDQNVVFLEGSPSSHVFPSATRGYKKLTAYFCYTPKGAATSEEEKHRQQTTVQYFQQASKALEAIDGKETTPSSRYQLSRRITFSPTKDKPDAAPGTATVGDSSSNSEDDETTDTTLTDQGYDSTTEDEDNYEYRGTRGSTVPGSSMGTAPNIGDTPNEKQQQVSDQIDMVQLRNMARARSSGIRPANIKYSRQGRAAERRQWDQ
ncbi:hypothetical protein MMC18_000630 [Xylographa bjoerkii]|nr:hypothetical protein [Xylographa bjoerkii]